MSKKCELTGKIPMKGHNVSHANNKTKRRFLPNLKKAKFTSELLKRSLTLTVSNAGMRCVCLLYTSPSPRDRTRSRMPSSA